jgi:hypothetical protein
MQKLENWFQNNRPKNAEKTKPKKDEQNLLVHWTLRKVVQHNMKDDINSLIAARHDGAQPGSQDYIKNYQGICSEVMEALTPAQKAEYERQVEEWNTTGPDPTTQAL